MFFPSYLPCLQVSGFTEVPRYFPYCGRSLAITKLLMCEQYPMEEELKQRIMMARSANEVYDIMGRDFWYVRPTHVCRYIRLCVTSLCVYVLSNRVITPCYRRETLQKLKDCCQDERDLATDPCVTSLPDTLSNEPDTLAWMKGIRAADVLNEIVLPEVTEENMRKGKELYYPSQHYNIYHAKTMALSDELGGQ